MNTQKYTAATMEAALAKVKSELGRDAVILHTRCYRKGGVLGIGGRDFVEVTASKDVKVQDRKSAATAVLPRPRSLDKVYQTDRSNAREFGEVKKDVALMRSMLEDLVKQTRPSRTTLWSEPMKKWYSYLVDSGVSDGNAIDILEPVVARLVGSAAPDAASLTRMVTRRISEVVNSASPIAAGTPGSPAIVAFVGATGVGKTTTIAKLAAHFALKKQQRVGLMTLDTYRIAAVEQLRTYARIIDVPLEVVLSPTEMPPALERLSDCSVIFIDTAGRSQRDTMKMNNLKGFFEKKKPDQTHLVLSATAERAAITDTLARFGIYSPDRILITKLDELPSYGKILDISALAPHPVSYLTTGQDVPDDIETARPERIAALVAGEARLDC